MKSLNIQFLVFAFVAMNHYTPAHSQTALDRYIQEGLTNNLVLQQKNISLRQAEQSLQIARSYFLPTITLLGDYTHGNGGRSIQIPIGDLLNPVYASLNDLTQRDDFPQIENVEQTFFPQNFYDARVRTSVPIINTDLHLNRKIHSQRILLKGYEVESYKRQLVLEIKAAYYQYLSTIAAVQIYESAAELVKKNREINESLLRNGKSLHANVLRSQSEEEKVNAELNSARSNVINARKYFNFLLNRTLDEEIISSDAETIATTVPESSIEGREEIGIMKSAVSIQESALELNKWSRVPKVNAFVDVGSQASDWKVNSDSRYYLAGVQVAVPLFQGSRNNIQISRAKLDVRHAELELRNVQSQLQMAADVAKQNYLTSRQNLSAGAEQVKAARSYFKLVEKGYQQGVNSLIEFVDARNQLTSSELQLVLRQYELLTAAAKLERETSSFNLPK